jgi:hypothetical protein
VGGCFSFLRGILGILFRRLPLRPGHLYEVDMVWIAVGLFEFKVLMTKRLWRSCSRSWIGVDLVFWCK